MLYNYCGRYKIFHLKGRNVQQNITNCFQIRRTNAKLKFPRQRDVSALFNMVPRAPLLFILSLCIVDSLLPTYCCHCWGNFDPIKSPPCLTPARYSPLPKICKRLFGLDLYLNGIFCFHNPRSICLLLILLCTYFNILLDWGQDWFKGNEEDWNVKCKKIQKNLHFTETIVSWQTMFCGIVINLKK